MYFKIIPREYSVTIYKTENDTQYSASCQVFIYGDKGFLHTLNGSGFYRCFSEEKQFYSFFDSFGIVSIEAYMMDDSVNHLENALGHLAEIEVIHKGNCAGLEMNWVKLTRKDGQKL